MKLTKPNVGFWALALASIILVCGVFDAKTSDAAAYRSSSISRSTYRPAPRVSAPKQVVVKKTTVVNQTVNQAAPASSGGFFSSFAGAAVGAGVVNHLMNSDNRSAPIDTAKSIESVKCLDASQNQVPCPEAAQ